MESFSGLSVQLYIAPAAIIRGAGKPVISYNKTDNVTILASDERSEN